MPPGHAPLALDTWLSPYKAAEKLTKRRTDLAAWQNPAAQLAQEVFKNSRPSRFGLLAASGGWFLNWP